MRVVTSQHSVQLPASCLEVEITHQPSQRWKLQKPQKELCKDLTKLFAAQFFCNTTALILTKVPGLGDKSYHALDQLWATSLLAGLFTLFNLGATWVCFIKSNQEKADGLAQAELQNPGLRH